MAMNPLPSLPARIAGTALWALVLTMAGGCARDVIHTGSPRTTASHSETPVAANFATTTQAKLQAGQHWLAIADDTGKSIAAAWRAGRYCPPKPGPCSPVFVRPPEVFTGFSRAFHNQLVTTLVNQGVSVSRQPDTELSMEVDVQPVLFSPNRPQYRYAGVPVELAPGVWALRDATTTDPVNAGQVPPAPDALHWFRSQFAAGQTPRAEILVTVSMGDRHRYLSRTTSAYYVADTDQHLYDEELCGLFKLCPAKADACGCPATPGKTGCCPGSTVIKVTGDCPIDQPCPPAAAQPAPAAAAPVAKVAAKSPAKPPAKAPAAGKDVAK